MRLFRVSSKAEARQTQFVAPIFSSQKGTLDVVHDHAREGVLVISFNSVIPVLRIFNIEKADEFYLGFLGFTVDWDHRFDPAGPLYRQISRGNLILHLSEHHGDGTPGVHVRVMMDGIEAFQREMSSKGYPYMRPGLETMPWGMIETGVIDPFGNFIRFCQRVEKSTTP
jgi:hypothetical protein